MIYEQLIKFVVIKYVIQAGNIKYTAKEYNINRMQHNL